ncbi:MAG: isoprenylcysteine carboxyl methyltransferase family protein [Acidobacteriota bacterium]
MVSRIFFLGLVLLVAAERLAELARSRRNRRRALARGGHEVGRAHYPWMVGVHAAFLVAAPLEVFLLRRPFVLALAAPMVTLLALAMALRYWAIAALGERWNTRIVVVPGEPAIVGGPYRLVRHPNYLAVVVEMFALPLVHTAWLTALVFSAANAVLLAVRVRSEERALAAAGDYRSRLGDRPRFLPGAF